VLKLGKDSWTVYFTFLGIYYSLLTRIFILLRTEDWEGGQHKILRLPQKKYISNISEAIKNFEDFTKIFPIGLSLFYLLKGIMDRKHLYDESTKFATISSNKKKSSYFEQGITVAQSMGMLLIQGLLHHWISSSLSVRDNPVIQQLKLLHAEEARKLFEEMNVTETQLLWK